VALLGLVRKTEGPRDILIPRAWCVFSLPERAMATA
jgi:hypothetical protein